MTQRTRTFDPVDLLAQIIIGTGETVAFAIFIWNVCEWWSITP